MCFIISKLTIIKTHRTKLPCKRHTTINGVSITIFVGTYIIVKYTIINFYIVTIAYT